MAIEDDILALLGTVDAKIDVIQSEIVAIKAITDNIDFYPYIIITGTLTPDVTGDYFYSGRNDYGNIYSNYKGYSIYPTATDYILYDGASATWAIDGSSVVGTYTPVSGATGDATGTLGYCVLSTPDPSTIKMLQPIPSPAIIDMRDK